MKKLLSSALALSVVFGLGTAIAIAEDKDNKFLEAWARFKELDANVNGELSLREFKRHLADGEVYKARSLFERMDRDSDSSLSFNEFRLGHLRK
jgi:Ca2+-binding EF-hand superfamily protein